MKIQIFITGGTFDKEYNELDGTLYFKDTHLQDIMRQGRCRYPYEPETLMLLDSLKMTDDHRASIALACNNCKTDKIVITHGTDTMAETGKYLSKIVKNKTVVLTGAMIPIAFGSSDGLFNLGSAVAFAQTLGHGVYVAMNGKYFDSAAVKKNKGTGVFEVIPD